MSPDDIDADFRKRIYSRALEEKNSNLWNFKRYYTAASFWFWLDVGTAVLTAFMGAILTYGLAWRTLPLWLMVTLSLLVGTISLIKAIQKPGQRSEKLHTLGRRYQQLYDELQNFVALDLENPEKDKEWIRDRFDELASKRHELKAEAQLSGFWYRWLKWRRGDEIYEEVSTTEDERDKLDPNRFVNDSGVGGGD